jgi:O-Antigen ligase
MGDNWPQYFKFANNVKCFFTNPAAGTEGGQKPQESGQFAVFWLSMKALNAKVTAGPLSKPARRLRSMEKNGDISGGGDNLRFSLRSMRLYRLAEKASETLIYLMIVFSPWAFGTTQTWSIRVMDVAGCLLGGLLLAKLAIRRQGGYQPPRWVPSPVSGQARTVVTSLAVLTGLILAYCLVSILNARSTYVPDQFQFTYHRWVNWLPHSYDRTSSWPAFWNYLALAGAFWAVSDWLPGKTTAEFRAERKAPGSSPAPVALLPGRLRRLLWVLSLNGALLAAEAILQRVTGTDKLLWLLPTHWNYEGIYHLGPYAYRNNGAQYFNLLWPAVLGFWWTAQRSAELAALRPGRPRQRVHHWLLPAILLMAACPIISASRAAVIVDLVTLALATLILMFALRRAHGATKFALFVFVLAVLGTGFAFGWEKFAERMKEFDEGLGGRERIYEMARPMAAEHPYFGTGPGTFNVLFQFYRDSTDAYWPAQLHDDWLETLITFGWVGSGLIALAFGLVLARRFVPGGLHCGWRFTLLLWLGLGSCLLHARFDFPFQVYSILFLFLVLCAILFNLSRRVDPED